VNPTESAQTLDFNFKGVEFRGKGTWRLMTAADLDATNLAGQKPGVEVKSSPVEGAPKSATVPAISIGIYELEAQ
jgi:hypothetical protein